MTISILQITPPPIPPPPPPGLPIDQGVILMALAGALLGGFIIHRLQPIKVEKDQQNFTIPSKYIREKAVKRLLSKSLQNVQSSLLQILKRIAMLWILILFIPNETTAQAVFSQDQLISNQRTWAIGGGVSNFIMHGDLRSIGTGELGNFWNFGGYLYADKMFNPILGLELKINYNNISGGAQYFSDIYEVLYVNNTTITNNLFFEGRAYGAELNMILSFSNLFKRDAKKWHLAGYFGIGYHHYDSRLYEKQSNGTNTLLVDFGDNPARNNTKEASSIYLTTQLGIKYRLSRKIDLELRPSWYFNNEDHLDATISNKQVWESFFVTHLGLTLKLGKQKAYTIWVEQDTVNSPTLAIVDTDQDGVIDQLDVEPNTPKGAKVYGNGQSVDSDNDGISDHRDECPLQAGTAENQGCPVVKDSDNDGLFDQQDLCPLQPGPIENKGCPQFAQNDRVTLIKYISDLAANVYFDTGKWSLKEESKKVLDKMAQYITEVPEIDFTVEGHTDNRDRQQFNLYLSQKRADAVRKYLLKKGISPKRLTFIGYGETRPKYSNETPEGRQLNRRVEVKPATQVEQKINLEGKTETQDEGFHLVKEDETLFSIANKYNIPIEKLRALNNLKQDVVKVGQKLKIK
jgi:outer membrane protein OmpA-like peptidoglycan-associated protein